MGGFSLLGTLFFAGEALFSPHERPCFLSWEIGYIYCSAKWLRAVDRRW